jgi:ABC-type ATPase involved in cell division
MITKFKASKFTVFTDLNVEFSSGINIFVGQNGTGKTHLMKAVYSACCLINKKIDIPLDRKVKSVFNPNSIGRLVHRAVGRNSGYITIYRKNGNEERERSITLELTSQNKANVKHDSWFIDESVEAVFIPVKDMLANAPGFRSLFSQKKLAYEEVYLDIIDKAFVPIARGRLNSESGKLLNILAKAMSGRVIEKNETFYLKNKNGELEFPLLAEGFRKLGLLYRLIQNESLTRGSMLFWDEPEANLNPHLSQTVVKILLELSKMGVQIFISTHDYVLLKEFQLASTKGDSVLYHVLYRNDDGNIEHSSTNDLDELSPNAIDSTYSRILDDEIKIGLKGL